MGEVPQRAPGDSGGDTAAAGLPDAGSHSHLCFPA